MFKNYIYLLLISFYFLAFKCASVPAPPPFEYKVPHAERAPQINGEITETCGVWDITNSNILGNFSEPGDIMDEWYSCSDIPDINNDIEVVWQAIWYDSCIYISTTIIDSTLHSDNNGNANTSANIKQEDDSIHLWYTAQPSLNGQPIWPANNYLIHLTDTDLYTQIDDMENYNKIPLSPGFCYNRNVMGNKQAWYIESSIKNMNRKYQPGDTVWFEMTYNDSDPENKNWNSGFGYFERERRLSWNTRGTDAEEPAPKPWKRLGKLILQESPNSKLYEVKEVEDWYDIHTGNDIVVLDRAYNYKYQEKEFPCWQNWTDYSDAFVGWSAGWNPKKHKVYFNFEVRDDYKNSIHKSISEIKNDDGLFILIDLDSDQEYNSNKDLNVLLHNTGDIYLYSGGIAENYYKNQHSRVKAKVKNTATGWIANVEVDITDLNIKAGSTLGVEIGYNDADETNKREHQLVWSNFSNTQTPWKNFDSLGILKFSSKKIINNKKGK